MEGVINVETLEGILYRETSIIAEEDVELLMAVIRTYAAKPKKRSGEKHQCGKSGFTEWCQTFIMGTTNHWQTG